MAAKVLVTAVTVLGGTRAKKVVILKQLSQIKDDQKH